MGFTEEPGSVALEARAWEGCRTARRLADAGGHWPRPFGVSREYGRDANADVHSSVAGDTEPGGATRRRPPTGARRRRDRRIADDRAAAGVAADQRRARGTRVALQLLRPGRGAGPAAGRLQHRTGRFDHRVRGRYLGGSTVRRHPRLRPRDRTRWTRTAATRSTLTNNRHGRRHRPGLVAGRLPRIAFASSRDGNQEIYVMRRGRRQPAPTSPTIRAPTTRRPGRRMAAGSSSPRTATATSSSTSMDADGGNQTNLTNDDSGGDADPAWSPRP